jgi:hypothetical protein
MKTAIALVLYVLSLCGIDVNNETRVDRVVSNGSDVLYSRVVARPNGTRFECLRSASGQCYYTVFPEPCAKTSGRQAVDAAPRRSSVSRWPGVAAGGCRRWRRPAYASARTRRCGGRAATDGSGVTAGLVTLPSQAAGRRLPAG